MRAPAKRIMSMLALSFMLSWAGEMHAQSTAFTYQGRITENGTPANGKYDLKFRVYTPLSNGSAVSALLTMAATAVNNGVFTVTLDFGAGVFPGPPRWLEIGVRSAGSAAAFTTLAPRQPILASPYAITAGTVTGPINGGLIIPGSITNTQLAPGTAAANLGNLGPGGLPAGTQVLSGTENPALISAGYVRIGAISTGDAWWVHATDREPSARYAHTAVWTGS